MSAPSSGTIIDPNVVIAQLSQRVSQLENELKAKNKLLENVSNQEYPTASLSVPPHLAQTEKKIVAPTPPNSIAASGVTSPAFHSANVSMMSTRAVSPLIFEENESLTGMEVDGDDPELRAAIALSLQSEYDTKKGSHATPAPAPIQAAHPAPQNQHHSSPSHGPSPLPSHASLAAAVTLPLPKPQPVAASASPSVSAVPSQSSASTPSTPAPPSVSAPPAPSAPQPSPAVPAPAPAAPPSVTAGPSGKAEAKEEELDSTDPSSKKRKMLNLLDEYKVFEAEKAKIEEDYIAEQAKLVEEFEARAKRVFEVYDAKKLPHAEALGKLKKPICDLLDGAYVELQAKTIDSCYTDMHNRFPKYTRTYYGWGAAGGRNTTAGLLSRNDSGEPDIFAVIQHLKEKREKVLHEEQEKKRQELEKQVSEQREAQKKQERAEKALLNVIPMMPHLTLDQACRALEIHKDDQARTLDWLITTDLEQVYTRLTAPPTVAETAAKAAAMETDGLVEDPGMLPSQASMLPYRTPKLSRLNTEGGEKHVICKVLKVLDDATVEMRMVLDRNRIPCDPVAATRHVVPLAKLVEDPEFRIPSAAECLLIEEDKQKRIPVITFQVVGDELQPISINPPIRIGEYNLDWDSHNKMLRSVRHQNDGAILFKTVHDEADGLHVTFDYSSPVELYTQAIDAVTHNIVHMHLDDTRDDIAVDTVNLSGSDEKVEDKMKFEKDATGRQLAYRIVVRDEKVIAVLYRFGNEIKKGVFVEHQVPAVGSLVYLPGDKYATVTAIPVGLVVTTNPRDIEKPVESPALKRAPSCVRKHPAEMTGFLMVSVIAEKGQILDNPVEESLPVCQVKVATADQHAMLESLRDSKVNSLLGSITSKLEIIEAAVDGRSSTPVSELSELRRQIAELQIAPQTAPLLDANYKQRINKAFNALRLMALNARAPTKQ